MDWPWCYISWSALRICGRSQKKRNKWWGQPNLDATYLATYDLDATYFATYHLCATYHATYHLDATYNLQVCLLLHLHHLPSLLLLQRRPGQVKISFLWSFLKIFLPLVLSKIGSAPLASNLEMIFGLQSNTRTPGRINLQLLALATRSWHCR